MTSQEEITSILIEKDLLLFDHALAAAKIVDTQEIKAIQSSLEMEQLRIASNERIAEANAFAPAPATKEYDPGRFSTFNSSLKFFWFHSDVIEIAALVLELPELVQKSSSELPTKLDRLNKLIAEVDKVQRYSN